MTNHRPITSRNRKVAQRLAAACAALVPVLGNAQAPPDMGAQSIQVIQRAEAATQAGPEAYFTGRVQVRMLIEAMPGASLTAAWVAFEPGARAAWHTHPRGQRLLVTSGTGRVQQWGQPAETIRDGDVVVIPAGVKHWHGAAPTTAMAHIAMQDSADGQNVVWLERVTDAQYAAVEPAAIAKTSPAGKQGPYADVAPDLDRYTRDVLFGEVWENPVLGKRDRSLVTVAALVSGYRMNELPYHLKLAQQNGVTRDELTGLITHLAFYAGWPAANTAVEVAREVFKETR